MKYYVVCFDSFDSCLLTRTAMMRGHQLASEEAAKRLCAFLNKKERMKADGDHWSVMTYTQMVKWVYRYR